MNPRSRPRPNQGGEQNRRKQKSGDPTVEKNPPRNPDGLTANELQNERPEEQPAGSRRRRGAP